ncbi:hypothetical protein DAEQUDRAFT_731667 [Daedalea quercina L-15889]|uniref:Uncharacterized protein n=1 Tax=Daedalea quercina L-15889 TaxID=1314783 RepID=A0A165M5X0_9APHY|nr:hypothetical protein DAEQUDRAFT_731667 [Daedalea quercina L-15889]
MAIFVLQRLRHHEECFSASVEDSSRHLCVPPTLPPMIFSGLVSDERSYAGSKPKTFDS